MRQVETISQTLFCNYNETDLREIAALVVSEGYLAAGYSTFNLDDCACPIRHTVRGLASSTNTVVLPVTSSPCRLAGISQCYGEEGRGSGSLAHVAHVKYARDTARPLPSRCRAASSPTAPSVPTATCARSSPTSSRSGCASACTATREPRRARGAPAAWAMRRWTLRRTQRGAWITSRWGVGTEVRRAHGDPRPAAATTRSSVTTPAPRAHVWQYDNCNNNNVDPHVRYIAMATALNASGRAIEFSACSWGVSDTWAWIGEC